MSGRESGREPGRAAIGRSLQRVAARARDTVAIAMARASLGSHRFTLGSWGSALLAGLIALPPLVAAAKVCGVGPFSVTALSGKATGKHHDARAKTQRDGSRIAGPDAAYALHSIMVEETKAGPCRMLLSFMPLPASTKLAEFAQAVMQLGGCGTGTHRTVGVEGTDVIVAARACIDSGPAPKLRGLQLFPGTLGKDGHTITRSAYTGESLDHSKFAAPQCPEGGWQSEVACPENQVAIGLRATHDGKGYAGIALECAPVGSCE